MRESFAGTQVVAPIVPGGTGDLFPTHIDIFGKGGYRAVSGIVELNQIPTTRRSAGMMVHTYEDGKFWILDTGLDPETNTLQTWIQLPFDSKEAFLNYENVLFVTGDQDLSSGIKNFRSNAYFRGKTTAASGVFFNLQVFRNFAFYGPRVLDTGCTEQWCQIPEDEQEDPEMPFDPRRPLTGNKGYSSEGRPTIRIGPGIVSGAKTNIFTIWFGRTGIGESGLGWEFPMATRDRSLTLRRPSSLIYPRLRGVELFSPAFASGTFDDLPEGGTEEEIQQESQININQIRSEGTGPAEPGNLNNGGDSGGAGGGFGLNLGVGVLMLFTNNAPRLVLKDQYTRRFRAFTAVEKGSSWPTGLSLFWGPFSGHLFTNERYIAESELLQGTGLGPNGEYGSVAWEPSVGSQLQQFPITGLYNITGKITWDLFFTGKIAGYRGDYNIEPWTGHSSSELYPVLKRYWGASEKTSLTADEITGLLSGQFAFDPRQVGSSSKLITPNGKYIYFAWPADSGFNNIDFFRNYSESPIIQTVPEGYKFLVNGQEGSFQRSIVSGVKNRYGYEEDYYLFRNRWISNGTDPIRVSVEVVNE